MSYTDDDRTPRAVRRAFKLTRRDLHRVVAKALPGARYTEVFVKDTAGRQVQGEVAAPGYKPVGVRYHPHDSREQQAAWQTIAACLQDASFVESLTLEVSP